MAQAVVPLMIASTVLSAGSAISQGDAAKKVAGYEAKQFDAQANREFASGTRESAEYARKGRILASNARAQMAGSGGVTDDPQATEILGEIAGNAKYNALAAMYSAETRSKGLRDRGKGRRVEGRIAQRAGRWSALGTAIGGASQVAAYR